MDNNLKKKTLLVFPPFMYQGVREPYLSVPLLTGYLRRRNIPVDQRDLNVEFYHRIINQETMEQIMKEFERRFDDCQGDSEPGTEKAPQHQVHLQNLMEASCILKNLEWMKTDRTHSIRLGFALKKLNSNFERVPSLQDFTNLKTLVENDENPYIKTLQDFFIEDIIKAKYQVIGISVAMGSQLIPALTLAYLVHLADAGIHITLGGAAINLADDDICTAVGSLPYIHSIVRFGSGKTLYELISALDEDIKLCEIPNVIDCTSGTPVFAPSYVMPDIQDESDPVFDEKFLSDYPERYYLPVMYAIGCYWGRCSYCSNVEQTRHHFMLKKPEQFVDEIEALSKKHNQKRFCFIGEALPPSYAEAITDEIAKRKMDLRFWSYIRIDGKFTRGIIEKLAKAGCNKVTIGAESTNNRILKLMKKGYTRDMIYRQLEWVKEAGIEIKFNIIWDFPSTTREEALKILSDIEELKKRFNLLTIFNFSLEKNSDMGRSPDKYYLQIMRDQIESSTMQTMKHFYNELEYIDTRGMNLREKESLLPSFQKLSLEILVREIRRELGLNSLEESDWDRVLDTARKFIVLRETNNKTPGNERDYGTSKQYYYHHFLNSQTKMIDQQRFYYLNQLIEEKATGLEDLAGKMAHSGREAKRAVERRLRSIIDNFILP
jgi:radical SAM superfamily enzyme YgiQ (UPF0313 family)